MKKLNKKGIVKLIILIILIIMQIKAFDNSRANKLTYMTAKIIDSSGLLSDESCTMIAINEGDNGMAITLPDFINTKKINKYIVTKKEIMETENKTQEEEIITETENKIPEEETITETENEMPEETIQETESEIPGEETIIETESEIPEEETITETENEIPEEAVTEIESETTENEIIAETESETSEETITETEATVTTVEMEPGEKIYLTQEEINALEIELTVQYDTIDVDSQTLYNKKITIKDEEDYELLSVSGYMPYDTEIQTNEIDISNLETRIIAKYPNTFIYANYDINLISNGEQYITTQPLNVDISIFDETQTYYLLDVKGNDFTEIKEKEKIDGKIKFTTEELNTYIVLKLEEGATTYVVEKDGSEKLEIDDFENDKNYYLGLNYTEGMTKENSGKYTESNLKEVTVNYYGYDYNITEFVEPEEYDISLNATARRSATGNIQQSGNGNNRRYARTDTISCTISGINALKQQYPGFRVDSGWTMQIAVPSDDFETYFSVDNTDSANSTNGISVSVNDGIITVTGANASGIEGNSDTWTFTFSVSFYGNNRNNINNITYTDLTVNSFSTTIKIGEDTPYGTISDTELQTLVSYKKCVPTSNGNISLELIDNPFLNRPAGQGFNGWKTNDTRYSNSISTNTNTYVQTLNTNINNITDASGNYVINLYPDWVEANVIFVSSSGSAGNSGTSASSPVNNNWTNINNKLNSNIKTCSNASDREVNIIVLMNGTLEVNGLTGPNTPYTLTSLYKGTNYGSTSTYLNVGTTDFTADSDLQLHHLYVASTRSYTSPSGTTDGTAAVTPCIYGNMYNVRIGRGVVPTNSNNCTWGQIQGGYSNRSASEYKLMVEAGQYYTIQLYRAANASTSTTANATIVIGSDIERAKNNNSTLKIYNRMASRTTSATATPYQSGRLVNMIIKSGTIGVDYFNNASTADNSDRNYAGIYVGGHGNTGYDKGDRYLTVEGGNIANIIGGLSMDEDDMHKTYMYVKDGNVINITGGAGYTHTYGDRIIQVSGGCIKYSISGGSNGVAASSTGNNGQLTGTSLIYVGGTAQIGASSSIDENGTEIITPTNTNEVLYGVNAGCVCGGANGNDDYAGRTDASYIIIDGQAIIHNNVYGGGNYGVIGGEGEVVGAQVVELNNETANFTANTEYFVTTSTTGGNGLTVSGTALSNQIISTAMVPSDSGKWVFESASGDEYYLKNVSTGLYIYVESTTGSWWEQSASLVLSSTEKTAFTVGGTNTKTVTYSFTYNNGWRDQTATVYLKYDDGWVMTNGNTSLYLLTYEKLPEDEVTEDVDTLVNIKVFGGNVKNNIYGGANQNNIYGTVDIDMDNGTVNGTIYGGSNILGTISGSSLINISGGQLGTVSATEGFDYSSVDSVFGGGLGASTNIQGRVLLNINDTNNNVNIYGNAYGGSSLGTISGNVNINIQDIPTTANTISINGYVFGGGKGNVSTAATVIGDIDVNVDGSELGACSIFGGSNLNGDINGAITVNIGQTYKSTLLTVYGGGNQAAIGTETQGVKVYLLKNADVTNAFNGGKAADLISSSQGDKTREIYLKGGKAQNLYGGSDSSGIVTVSNVYIESGNATNVFGGNNLGGTTEITNISVTGGSSTNIYGGGNQAESDTSNIITSGGAVSNIYGGGNQAGVITTNVTTNGGNIGTIFGGSNTSGDVTESFVTTNNAETSTQTSGLTMEVTSTVSEAQDWQSTTYPTFAKIKVVFKNTTSNDITSWNANIFAPNSELFSNYSQSEILVNNGVYTLTEQNRYWGTNTITAGGNYTLEFEILSMQSVEEFNIGYGISGQDSSGNSVSFSEAIIGTVYGGNNQGGTTATTNVTINGGGVGTVYGGGNQAVTNVTNVNINGEVKKNVFGGGNQAGINTNTNVTITGATIGDNVYGGGNEGTVSQNTYVIVKDSTLNNSLYAGGNGASAVVYGNVNVTMHGTTNQVTNSVFGGGNQAATGTEATNNSQSIVNIAGGNIGGNVYGGANTSVVYGTTLTNIGYDAVGNTDLEIGDIYIKGTVFGGGEANASGSEIFDFDFISVTVAIDIQINGNNHQNFAILGSIFGSGNASSTSGTSNITIKNYGTPDKPQSNVSLQRTDCATIINSALSLSGATDRTNEYSGTFFSVSRVTEIKLKNNSTLYLCNGANLLNKLHSLVDIDGTETKGTVTINEETGETTRNVDNRVYMLEGKNLNVALNEKATLYGQVQGMFFFGLFTNRNNPATSTGLYHNGYENGEEITNAGTFVSNSYVMAEHLTNPEHDIRVDGFYTNYNEQGIIKTDYIHPTPDEDIYYMWLCGEEMEVKVFPIEMVASKYATLGTYELALSGFADPNIKFALAGFSSGLIGDVSLVEPSLIETIEPDEDKANTQFGLTMKTGNIGWQTKGETMFLTADGGTAVGTKNYNSDNTSFTPTLNFYFYHSQNLNKKQALGEVKIRFQVMTPIDDLNYGISYIDIDITLSTALFQDDYYEAAITPGQQFGLFTTTDTTITKSSALSTYYSLLLTDFSERDDAQEFQNYNRVLVSRDVNNLPYVFPENTKITMLDMATNKYYYYIVTANDVTNNKYIYELDNFIAMGSNDNKFNESEMFTQYYNTEQDLVYENFIFHVTLADTNLNEIIAQNSLLMELRNNESQTIIGVLGIQRENIVYTVYCDKEATIEVDGTVNPEVIYLGNPINLNVTTKFTQAVLGTKTIYDTQYFDKKLGIKISIYDSSGNRLNSDSLFGINFELDNQYYYPRIDGTTRICIADKVTDVLARIKINTENNTLLASGDYTIKVESFGSSDGIYYGLVASDMVELQVKIINFAYGLKATTNDKAKIIDKETGYTENGNNTIATTLKYSSSLSNPYIALSLYRRDYSDVYLQNYNLVDLKDYVSTILTSTGREKEYEVSTSPLPNATYYLNLKENLVTGTYKLVYKLYDGNTYIGEVYEYLIIK